MTVMEQEITWYVERVRAALADLPPAQRDELTEDLPEHLAEVAAEAGGTLVDRLGEPEAYAAELRAAAGAPVTAGPNLDQRVAGLVLGLRTRLRSLDDRLGPPLGYARASEYLRLLRPAWWLLRAYLAAMLVTVLTGNVFGVLPSVGSSRMAGLVLLAGCVVASLWLGRNAGRFGKWPRRAVLAGSLGLVLFGLIGFGTIEDRMRWGDYGYDTVSVNDQYANIQDVYVYDSEGRLLENVRLFDQNGTPIRLGWPNCPEFDDTKVDDPLRRTYPYCPSGAPFHFDPPAATATLAPPPPPATAAPAPSSAAPAPSSAAPAPDPTVTSAPSSAAPAAPVPTPNPVDPVPTD
ncbi:HAAS signaling domain-containing protein [Micromonospora cathayae]|uniref:Uncharacterized protein n=1 Tax=Micromonospora cathayae TaxID=3028804 RepID=A0ABY7ZVI3_9ACTN|nr:hypothetical protein [Micromonospora sp. HUAS 3]WDZ86878.1 hypothetical protein PVK37_11000 [Micromonospora sp. HUAS 3]